MTDSNILISLCLVFIAGIAVASFVRFPQSFWLGILILAVVLLVWGGIFHKKKLLIVGLWCLGFSSGLLRLKMASSASAFEKLHRYYDRQIVFQGLVKSEPEKRISQQMIVVESEKIRGRILIAAELYPEYEYGDRLKLKGKLIEPTQFEDFNYREYLAKNKVYSVMYYPEIKTLVRNQGNWFFQKLFAFKDKLRRSIDKILLPPESSILRAVLLGDKYILSEEFKEKLNRTGTRHIVAISGLHMVILSQVLLFLGLGLGLWRQHAFYLVLGLLFIYILMIGAPASALRAGIMTGLLLLAQKAGRLKSAGRSIVFAAVAMLLINPLLLKSDAGFQLSFAAVLSIVYLKPVIDERIKNLPNPIGLRDVLAMTISAQIGVLPLLIYHFKEISLISPISNLLIVPLLPAIMILGIILVLSAALWLPLAKIIAWPVWFLLAYVVKIVQWLAIFPSLNV